MYCRKCGRELITKQEKAGFNTINGKRLVRYWDVCPVRFASWRGHTDMYDEDDRVYDETTD